MISCLMCQAVIAGEDVRFPLHSGFDWQSIQFSLKFNRVSPQKRGGSSITQQLAKNLFLWPGRSYLRKIIEAYLTVLIEGCWPKRRILEVYLNVAQFGPNIFGVEAAARHFLSKTSAELCLKESALLAAVLPNPQLYPVEDPPPVVRYRQVMILAVMKKLNPQYLDTVDKRNAVIRKSTTSWIGRMLGPLRRSRRWVASFRRGHGYGVLRPRWWPKSWRWSLGPNGNYYEKQVTIFAGGERYEFQPAVWGPYRGHVHHGKLRPDSVWISSSLARLGLPVSCAPVLAAVSRMEGGFDAIQTYDRGKFSWGFVQFSATGGLSALLQKIRNCEPVLYERYFAAAGIDIRNGQIVITKKSKVLRGAAVANQLHDDPDLWKCFLMASQERAIQDVQIQSAYENYYLRILAARITCGEREFVLGELFENHEYGRAVLLDRAIHTGVVQASRLFQRAAESCGVKSSLQPDLLLATAREIDPVNNDRLDRLKHALKIETPGSHFSENEVSLNL